ncbi:MAG: class I SAM-dependent methyltransferase [Clostridia bacterium]|nr:class I SAM-dependent methyltransferase [Clostridia bacterium]
MNNSIDNGRQFDFGKTSSEYAKFRNIYPEELYDRLRSLGVAADNTSWLDLGTGTGILPNNLYNPNAAITGADLSEEQIAFAKKEAARNGRHINYLVTPAEKTGLPDSSFDVITAAQSFFYFDKEIMRSEIKRMLKPGGKFIKIFMTWDDNDSVASKSQQLVFEMNKNWESAKSALKDITDDLFEGRVTEKFFAAIPFTRENWHGRMCACRGTLASMDENTFKKWEEAHLKLLESFSHSFTVRHIVYISYFIL